MSVTRATPVRLGPTGTAEASSRCLMISARRRAGSGSQYVIAMGEAAKPAVPALLVAIEDENAWVRDGAAEALPQVSESLPDGLTRLESLPGTLRVSGPSLHERIGTLLQSLQTHGLEPQDLTIRKPTLEDVFISLTGRGLRE